MPWCPKCKNEYVAGIRVCADCGCELVDSLEDVGRQPVYFGEEEEMQQLAQFLSYSKIKTVKVSFSPKEGVHEVTVGEEDFSKAQQLTAVFVTQRAQEKAQNASEEGTPAGIVGACDSAAESLEGAGDSLGDESSEDGEALPEDLANAVHLGRSLRAASGGVYEEASKKAEEFKSGAYTLLVVGILGLVALALLISGVLPIRLNPATQWMLCLVMGILFLIFIVLGVQSFRSYGRLVQKAAREDEQEKALKAFCETLNAQTIDESLQTDDQDTEEMLYFKRSARMKQILSQQFEGLEEDYLDHFVDEIYQQIFGE